jgi:hypothetical protein
MLQHQVRQILLVWFWLHFNDLLGGQDGQIEKFAKNDQSSMAMKNTLQFISFENTSFLTDHLGFIT